METVAETKTTVDNQTAAAPQQYTIVPDDSKPIFEDDTLLCELLRLGQLPIACFQSTVRMHTTRLTPALPLPPPTSRVSDPRTLPSDQPLSTCPSLPRASPSRLPRRNWLHPTHTTTCPQWTPAARRTQQSRWTRPRPVCWAWPPSAFQQRGAPPPPAPLRRSPSTLMVHGGSRPRNGARAHAATRRGD